MTSTFRLPEAGRIDRSRPVRFEFDGKRYHGFAGDTLASALLANGVHLIGRSFKYHRPRGILAAGSEEPNALVTLWRDTARYTPNLRATQVELFDGLRAQSQNRWPGLSFDVGAINDLLSPFVPAGFYYKTFMWPRKAWRLLYEPKIRAAAGLGRAPIEADTDRYSMRYAHCDVLVVGAGPAGIAAALAACEAGARVVLCDEQSEFGGSLLGTSQVVIDAKPAAHWIETAIATLRRSAHVTLLSRTTAFGYFPHNLIGLCERLTDHLPTPAQIGPRERLWQVRAKEVVIAAGSIERPLVFPGNDRPGIMLASAARTYLHRYGVIAGRRVVVLAGCDDAYGVALDLRSAGAEIAAVADVRTSPQGPMIDAAQRAGLPVHVASTVTGTYGRLRVSAVSLAAVDAASKHVGADRKMPCDLLLMSGGFTPSVQLFSQSRGKLDWHDGRQAFVPGQAIERVRCAGACSGTSGLATALEHGASMGLAAARAALAGVDGAPHSAETPTHAPRRLVTGVIDAAPGGGYLGRLPRRDSSAASKSFVDWQNDVTVNDLLLATREGFRSIEHIKRYTTTGMATDQGKTSGVNALGIVAQELEVPIERVGLTTFRMPFTPVTFGTFAGYARGDLLDPVRTTPMHDFAVGHGAVFEDVGQWKRARYFSRHGETMSAAVVRECRAVRAGCGIFDASTLGKIEVVGRDAVTFMNRMYVNDWSALRPGRSKYGVLLRDDGFIFDDGVVAKLAEDRFHVTTTTGGAARVLALMEDYLQTEWPDLGVWLTSTTEQWAVIAVQGPNARRVLEPLVSDIDISAQAMPHMSVASGRILGVPMRLFRVSFTGELGFEVNVPADFGPALMEAICAAGIEHGITCYGTETMHVLRAEKGYIVVGQDTDGTVTPDDAGLAWCIGKNKTDFLGKRSLQRPAMNAPTRKQFVGLLPRDPRHLVEEGAQVAQESSGRQTFRSIGHVTSSYFSAALNRTFALALISSGRARIGETLYIPMPDGDIAAEVTSPVFFDAKGERLHA